MDKNLRRGFGLLHRLNGRPLALGQGLHARGAQALGDVVGQVGIAVCQARRQAPRVGVGSLIGLHAGFCGAVHSTIPLAFSALLRVCTARKQCVLTLPSEQPMAAAVSATSISSQ